MSNWYPIGNPFFENIHNYNGMEHTRYTTSIRNLVYSSFREEDLTNLLNGYRKPDDNIKRGIEVVFNFEYPILNETFESEIVGNINPKELFEKAFISKYFTDEIAFESFAEFQMKLCGKLLEIIPIYNAKCKLLFDTSYKDLFGGYILDETFDNTHKDKNENNGTNQNVGTRFPINNIGNAWYNTSNENYATDSGAVKNNSTLDNNGEYHNVRHEDKTNKADIEKIAKFNKMMNNILSGTLNEFKYLFIGIR